MFSLILPLDVIQQLEAEKEAERHEAWLNAQNPFAEAYHYDEATDTLTVRRTQDCQGAVDYAQRMRNERGSNGYTEDGTARHIGEIPMSIVEAEYLRGNTDILRDNKALRRILESADYSKLRTVDKL